MKIIALEEHFLPIALREAWSQLDPTYQDPVAATLGTPNGIFSRNYLKWSLDVMPAERIISSTDYPYRIAADGGARDFIEKSGLDDATKNLIASGNWQRLSAQIKQEGVSDIQKTAQTGGE